MVPRRGALQSLSKQPMELPAPLSRGLGGVWLVIVDLMVED